MKILIKKYINEKIVTASNSFHKNRIFFFKEIGKIEVIKEIKYLDIWVLAGDIPIKIIKRFHDWQFLLPKTLIYVWIKENL